VAEDIPGLAVRALAVEALAAVLDHGRSVDEFLDGSNAVKALAPRDRAFLMALVQTSLRHKAEIDTVLESFLSKQLPRKSGTAAYILASAAAQLLFLDAPPHAAIDLAVRLAKADRNATHFSGLVNAVLRKLSTEGKARLPGRGSNVPEWLWARWSKAYGVELANAIAAACAMEAALDISVKGDAEGWAKRLDGALLPTGSVRLAGHKGMIDGLPGFSEGAWWVQDAAAAIPARLLGEMRGKRVLDLCAAPGGKTLQLAAMGAYVTALDHSAARLERLKENLQRTGLSATLVAADVLDYTPDEAFDAVLLDAPCSATGTLRRHPDLPFLKSTAQIDSLSALQRKLLARAAQVVKPGGHLVYCTCSLEPAEGDAQVATFLKAEPSFNLAAVTPGEAGLEAHFVTRDGYFRSLPSMNIGGLAGLDGFFAARLTKAS
jgi:16S rRNA (cytosine967-C5)-methyltransferase